MALFDMEVQVPTKVVLTRLQKNRDNHRSIFEQAVERFRAVAVQKLNERIDEIKAGTSTNTYVRVYVPEDHTDDYDRAIRMLELHTGDTIVMTESTYRQFYDDDWDWKEHWTETTSAYVKAEI